MQDREKAIEQLPGTGAIMRSRHDGLGTFLQVSEEVEEVLGFTSEEVLGQSSAQNIHPDDLPVVEEAFEAAWRLRRPVTLISRTRARDGMYHWIASRFELVKNNGRDEFAAATRIVADAEARASFRIEDPA